MEFEEFLAVVKRVRPLWHQSFGHTISRVDLIVAGIWQGRNGGEAPPGWDRKLGSPPIFRLVGRNSLAAGATRKLAGGEDDKEEDAWPWKTWSFHGV